MDRAVYFAFTFRVENWSGQNTRLHALPSEASPPEACPKTRFVPTGTTQASGSEAISPLGGHCSCLRCNVPRQAAACLASWPTHLRDHASICPAHHAHTICKAVRLGMCCQAAPEWLGCLETELCLRALVKSFFFPVQSLRCYLPFYLCRTHKLCVHDTCLVFLQCSLTSRCCLARGLWPCSTHHLNGEGSACACLHLLIHGAPWSAPVCRTDGMLDI